MAKMSKAEQDDIVETLLADIENIDTDELDEVYEKLDPGAPRGGRRRHPKVRGQCDWFYKLGL